MTAAHPGPVPRRAGGIACAVAAVVLLVAAPLPAQPPAPRSVRAAGGPLVEGRAEVIAARAVTVHAGAALLWPASPYLSVGPLVAGGMTSMPAARPSVAGTDGTTARDVRASVRAEVVARFTPDPRPAAAWRLYGQAAAGVLAVRGSAGRALVSVAVGVEHAPARPARSLRPAIEVGVGGGLRVAVALRGALP